MLKQETEASVVPKNSLKVLDGEAGKSSSLGVIFDQFALDNRLGSVDGLPNVLFMIPSN